MPDRIPEGFDELIADYGDPRPFLHRHGDRIDVDPEWPRKILTRIDLPDGLPLSWDLGVQVSRISCHKAVAGSLSVILEEVHHEGLWPRMRSFGGCYAFRLMRGGTRFSVHCWAAAFDYAVLTNQLGTPGDQDPGILAIFREHGWVWGGDFARPDPMHQQRVRGY